jgi:hypothetical protein
MDLQQAALSSSWATLLVLFGILVSLVLPVAVRTLKKAGGLESTEGRPPTLGQRISAAWRRYGGNKYLAILLAAAVVAVVIIFVLGLQFYTRRDAMLAGFAWESFIKKVFALQDPKT